ncbi:hypothetical protein [Paenibacillus sp. FSL L8-0506]|uniref:hypothetical protein n=1 Tax=Paenibacillus sp. FSL L8-0506 TaxID=2975335 RepID=UPI0030F61E8B
MNNEYQLSKPVYIPSVEASDIYDHMFRERKIELNYIGMIPSSLELEKLLKEGFNTFSTKTNKKLMSNDIINLKFKRTVDSAETIISKSKGNLLNLSKNTDLNEKQLEYKGKLSQFVDFLEDVLKNNKVEHWKNIKKDDLRNLIYNNGFVLKSVNDKTGEITTDEYVVYKRSSAKSREGQCLFIKKKLHATMDQWSKMLLNFNGEKIDYASLLAYESLVGSSIEKVIKIEAHNILIVDDVKSLFKHKCNVIRTGTMQRLESNYENYSVAQNLFDGESLLDKRYYPKSKAMMLLRNHMFKSAAFNCNIQDYLKQSHKRPEKIPYDEWQITDMFGNQIYAKDIHLIITPSSLKALKFSKYVGTQSNMWEYWKDCIKKDDYMFGVCKSEKQSKLGCDDQGKPLNQTSYQMLNSLPASKKDIEELTRFEHEYIEKLKNNDEFFIRHITKTANTINTHNMMVDLYNKNNDFIRSELFRDFRTKQINNHVSHVKKGKVRITGDYCTLLGNPLEFLAHVVGDFDEKNASLKGNEVYTTLFDFDTDLVGFRNPHTSPSNVLLAKNTYNKDIETFFNLSDNIVVVNCINFPLQDILSGSDFDSDTLLLTNNKTIINLAKKCQNYKVCINDVGSEALTYRVKNINMSRIDNQLSTSQMNIGVVVNTGQLLMSEYWRFKKKIDTDKKILTELLNKINVVTVLSGICIDLAKKMYAIDINKEIKNLINDNDLKPLFWRNISKKKKKKEIEVVNYNCPMDYLHLDMSKIKYADSKKNLEIIDLVNRYDKRKVDRKQSAKILEQLDIQSSKINSINGQSLSQLEKDRAIDSILRYFEYFIGKLKVNEHTMASILIKLLEEKTDNNVKSTGKMMNTLYITHKDSFINSFK